MDILAGNARSNDPNPIFEYEFYDGYAATVHLKHSTKGEPAYYWAKFHMPICLEDLCNPMDLIVKWDLLGNFKDYEEFPHNPLTKFDHQAFDSLDHRKLKTIIQNDASILQDYKMTDLVDTTKLVYSREVNGMTGATNKTFHSEVVSGAVYTSYALWHVVNGGIKEQLKQYTQGMLDEDLVVTMLRSDNENYHRFFLAQRTPLSNREKEEVLKLVFSENDYLGVKAVERLGKTFWSQDLGVATVFSHFLSLGTPVKNAVLDWLMEVEISTENLGTLISFLKNGEDINKVKVYPILIQNKESLNPTTLEQLIEYLTTIREEWKLEEYRLIEKLNLKFDNK
ncbi:hypothetical protein GCM10028791_21810 [Echinicola sediminis]